MHEIIKTRKEFEQIVPYETEQKFLPLDPERLTAFRTEAAPLEQYYLSHPDEGFSLRCRETFRDGELRYEATLKSRGEATADGLRRLEVTTPISADMYRYYREEMPLLRKLRAEPLPLVAVDFFEDGHVQVESEHPAAWRQFCDRYDLQGQFADLTGDRFVDNEWRAHLHYRRTHDGQEALVPTATLKPETVVEEILRTRTPGRCHAVQIRGRSGSGKSTLVQEVRRQLQEHGLASDVISTDDYHRGKTWLEARTGGRSWTDWDDPIVYDTAAMAQDLERLKEGRPVPRRSIDFTVVEPNYDGERHPVPVLLVEGIYAGNADIAPHCELAYAVPTPLATCIGRRLLRDMKERPQFADPAVSLRYMLEYAEPAYRRQTAG